MIKLPDHMSFTTAAAVPVVFATAYYSLVCVANLQAGETVLIHSGAGGVGQAAIRLAQRLKARVFTTVGSSQKKQLLKDMYAIPESCIFSSRDSDFVRKVKRMTGGVGVDVVLNSLACELRNASWDCVAPLGRFIELGKADSNSSRLGSSMMPIRNSVSFSSVSLDEVMSRAKPLMARVMQAISSLIAEVGQTVLPQPLQIYRLNHIVEAFRHMASGSSSGKIVIEFSDDDTVPVSVHSSRPTR